MGRQVKLTILNDNSSPNQVVTNYNTLISADHVDLTFGPFSSLLTAPASAVAARNGYAFVEGAGGAPSVFNTTANEDDHNVFDVSLPIADELMPFVNYIQSLGHAADTKLTAAYPMANDPFADPPVQLAQQKLAGARRQDGVLEHLPRGGLELRRPRPRRGAEAAGHRGARIHRRADRAGVHEGVPAAALHAEDVHRGGRPRPGRRRSSRRWARATPTR